MSTEQVLMAELEKSVLGAVIERPDDHGRLFLERLPAERFNGGRQMIARTLATMLVEGSPVSQLLLLEEMRKRNLVAAETGVVISDCCVLGSRSPSPRADMEALSRHYLAHETYLAAARLQQRVQEMEVTEALALTVTEVERLQRIDQGRLPQQLTYLDDILTGEDVGIDWLIPGIVARGTSAMLTAGEGAGKSTLLRQIALAAMTGLDPFDPGMGPRYAPRRVLLVDCEVSSDQLTRSLRSLWSYAVKFAEEVPQKTMVVESQQAGWDLSRGRDQATLLRMVRDHRPDLVIVTPVYRMADSDLNTEEGVRSWQRPLEPLLADGITFLTEHHPPNGATGSVRDLRPIGSSVLRRWFGQGVGVRLHNCAQHDQRYCHNGCPRRAGVEQWRGPRDETRWPHRIRGAQGWTWWIRDEEAEMYA